VLLLSSSASVGDQKRCDELRIAARLLKPAKQSLLLDHIMRIMVGTTHDRTPAAPVEPAPAGAEPAAETLDVLLAEDNPVNVKFALKVLERAGHRVVVAGNGREAVELWSSKPFDLILMDVQMPEMDGLEATRAIRAAEKERGANDSARRTPIIAMTANAMAGDREICLDAGMDGYVTKPVKRESLFEELSRVMARGGKHAAV
jgi:protein-histidine pros-kinase